MFFGTARINEKNHLEIGGCDTVQLAREFGTPLYVMDEQLLRENCRTYKNTLYDLYKNSEVIYAGKAFLTMAMCQLLKEEGLSLDVVSGGELYTAIKAGFPAKRIYFHGNNKSYDELKMAIECGVGTIIVDNFYELEMLKDLSKKYQHVVKLLLRITPGIEAHTHDYIKTGQLDSKFGFTLENGHALMAVENVLGMKFLRLMGFHCHIGSQIFEEEPFKMTIEVMLNFAKKLSEKYSFETRQLDLGGGFGIKYSDEDKPLSVKTYLTTIVENIKKCAERLGLHVPKILIEPGRAIVGNAGTTLYTIGAIKDIPGIRKYISVDGGMSDNIRPALYGAKYNGIVANKAGTIPEEKVSIAGKCCESGDMLIWDIKLPRITPGDILAVLCTGAYQYSMSSNYNMLPRPAVVFVKSGNVKLTNKRETYEDLLRNDLFFNNMRTVSFG
jgi:diaminopimelate decarboxylase